MKKAALPLVKLTKKEKAGLQIRDISAPLFLLAVNTHVDDLENIADDSDLAWFRNLLESDFGNVKLER